jgi:predicted DNA-binding transcriptional regulator YafY
MNASNFVVGRWTQFEYRKPEQDSTQWKVRAGTVVSVRKDWVLIADERTGGLRSFRFDRMRRTIRRAY